MSILKILRRKLRVILRTGLVKYISFYLVKNGDFSYFEDFDYWQQNGFNLIPNHFYQPIPDTSELNWGKVSKGSLMAGVKFNENKQLRLLKRFNHFSGEFKNFQKISPEVDVHNDPNFYFGNLAFDGVDALVYYSMVRSFKPSRIIEVGSGWSTKIAAQACLENNLGDLISIEPYPQPVLEKSFPGFNKLIEKKVQDIPFSFFEKLKEGDFLFIDSSHTIKIGGDVNYLVLDILPRLKKGVIVHIHDIFFPYDYPQDWVMKDHRFWTEQYLVHAFLLFNDKFEIMYANNYMGTKYQLEVKKVFGSVTNKICGGSLWMRRTS